jgi:hypothetical protein
MIPTFSHHQLEAEESFHLLFPFLVAAKYLKVHRELPQGIRPDHPPERNVVSYLSTEVDLSFHWLIYLSTLLHMPMPDFHTPASVRTVWGMSALANSRPFGCLFIIQIRSDHFSHRFPSQIDRKFPGNLLGWMVQILFLNFRKENKGIKYVKLGSHPNWSVTLFAFFYWPFS